MGYVFSVVMSPVVALCNARKLVNSVLFDTEYDDDDYDAQRRSMLHDDNAMIKRRVDEILILI
jgi:hypothetical protein